MVFHVKFNEIPRHKATGMHIKIISDFIETVTPVPFHISPRYFAMKQ